MTTESQMRVSVKELPATLDIELGAGFIGRALADMSMRAALERPDDDAEAGHAMVHVEVHGNTGAQVFVRGRMRGWFEVACSRCVKAARVPLDEELTATYVPRSQVVGDQDADAVDEEGVELSVEDLDVNGYEGDEIDLEPLLREQLILAVPFAPLCSEGCKGLCPRCGADLNHETCTCEPIIDPRLAGLKDIKL
jgi:uncharacterized protein